MKKQLLIFGSLILGLAACNDNSTPATTTVNTNPGDTTIKTTTSTTTTTTTSIHPIANFERRTFVNVKTGKPVKLRIDTVHHYYVDEITNHQPDYYYFDPAAHDTFDYQGRLLNNALIYNNGSYSIDESRLMNDMNNNDNGQAAPVTGDDNSTSGKSKSKMKDDMTKEKTDNMKVKITDDKIKIKTK